MDQNLLTNDKISPVEPDNKMHLGSLHLARNKLSTIDLNLFERCYFDMLFVSGNPTTVIQSPTYPNKVHIKKLQVTDLVLIEFPELSLGETFEGINLYRNEMTKINMSFFVNLQAVNIETNPIETIIPSNIQLTELKSFGLSSCLLTGQFDLEYVNGNITPALNSLALQMNDLTGLVPPRTEILTSITTFQAKGNDFTQLTMDFYASYMPRIEKLDVSRNVITEVSDLSIFCVFTIPPVFKLFVSGNLHWLYSY